MQKQNFLADNSDIEFHVRSRINFDKIFALSDAEERSAVSATSGKELCNAWWDVLSTLGELTGTEIASNAPLVEKQSLQLDAEGEVLFPPAIAQNRQKLLELGVSALGVHPQFGGLGAPFVAEMVATELIYRACPSTYLNVCWYSSIAAIIEAFGSEQQKSTVIPKIAAGEISGSMALTEADAGSDLANIRTYAEKQADGSWRLFGSKRFISNGCGEVSLVLAKNRKGASTLNDLNLYLVYRQHSGVKNFSVTKLEEKLALHGSATCELQFDGSVAEIVGEDGQGFRYMLSLMNDARIAVAMQGLGLMEGSFRLAKEYAGTRKTWGKEIAKHELVAQMLLDMEVEILGLRSLIYQAGYHRTLTHLIERKLNANDLSAAMRTQLESEVAESRSRVRRWTPLLKWWAGEKAFAHARTALQIHGGYGFINEYKAQWWLRESVIISIYEGTSQIQSLMCIKDTLKDVIRRPTEFVETALGVRMRSISEQDALRKKVLRTRQILNSSIIALLYRLVKVNIRASLSETNPTDVLKILKILSRDLVKFENISPALLHAERITEMKALSEMSTRLWADAKVDAKRSWIAERFVNKAIPRMTQLKAEIEMDDPVIWQRL